MSASREFLDQAEQPVWRSELPVGAPFNLLATVRLLQRRPTNRVDRWQAGSYWRAVETAQGVRLLRVTSQGTSAEPILTLEAYGGEVSEEVAGSLVAMVRWMLGLDASPAPTVWLTEVEPQLAAVLEVLDGFRTPCFPTLFETCAAVIPFQQLSLDAGTAIVGRLVERFGHSIPLFNQSWFSFPTPDSIAIAPSSELRETGLSATKASALQALAQLTIDGTLDAERLRTLPTTEALASLRTLPGIGPWSAGLILLRGLRRLDSFPEGDVGAARNLTALYAPPRPFTPATASACAARFGDQRGYLYFLGLGEQLRRRGLLDPESES